MQPRLPPYQRGCLIPNTLSARVENRMPLTRLQKDSTHLEAGLDTPRRMRKAAKHRYLSISKEQSLHKLINELPAPGTDLWIITNGDGTQRLDNEQFEFGHFIPVLAEMLGGSCVCYLSTWSMNMDHAQALLDALDTGLLKSLSMLSDRSFQGRKSAIAATLIEGLQARHQRYKTFPNHAKVLALASSDNTRFCVVFGSANLSQQPRAENYVLTTDPEAYCFVVDEFFESIFHAHQGKAQSRKT